MDLFQQDIANTTVMLVETAASNSMNTTARNQKLIKSMLLNMRFVSFMCNFWTVVLSLACMFQLTKQYRAIKTSRTNNYESTLKKRLYLTTIGFVSLMLM